MSEKKLFVLFDDEKIPCGAGNWYKEATEQDLKELGWVKADKIRELREELASLEHEQWMAWSTELVKNEKLSQDRIERWKKYWVPYNDLSEKEKQFDRCWVDKLLEKILGSGKHKEKEKKG